MTSLLGALALSAVASTNPQAVDFQRVNGASDPMYVVAGSIVRSEHLTFVTVITPLDELGLMSMRLEMDCTARRYRPLVVSFYNLDGSPRSSIGGNDGTGAQAGWATRNAVEIADLVCP